MDMDEVIGAPTFTRTVVPLTVEEVTRRAVELDRGRRVQVDTQRATINRLLVDPDHGAEVAELCAQLADARARMERVLDAVDDGSRKRSSIAREVARILEGDPYL